MELLNMNKVPASISRRNSKSTNYKYIDKITIRPRLWENFKKAFEVFKINGINDTLKLYKDPCFDEEEEVNLKTEAQLHFHMFSILKEVFNQNLFKKNDDSITEKRLQFYFNDIQADADLNLKAKEDIIAKIEVKSKNVISNLNLHEDYHNITAVKAIIHQFSYYLDKFKIQYGIISSLEKSWFFKLDLEKKDLLISQEFDRDDFLYSIYFFIKNYIIPSLANNENA